MDHQIPKTASPATPDRLAGAVLAQLQRKRKRVRIGGVMRGVLGAVLTFGVWPLVKWPRRLRDLGVTQGAEVAHLFEWVRLQSGYPEYDLTALRRATEGVRPRVSLGLVGLIAVAGVAAVLAVLGRRYGLELGDLGRAMWNPGRTDWGDFGDPVRLSAPDQVHAVWVAGLTVAYALHWLAVQLVARDVRRFVAAFNDVTGREGLAPVAMPAVGVGVSLGWLTAGVVLVAMGAWWGVPFAVAGAAHQRLAQHVMPRTRDGLAETLRTMLLIRRPAMRVPAMVRLTQRCPNPLCGAKTSAAANFCPRCGTRVSGTVNQVA